MNWRDLIMRIFTSRYTQSLEDEVIRLREENRALINSVLSVAGLPPLRLEAEIGRERHRTEIAAKKRAPAADAERGARGTFGTIIPPARSTKPVRPSVNLEETDPTPSPQLTEQGIMLPANPHRRRSWQQINRILEIEETRQMMNRDNSESMKPTPIPRSNA